MNFFIILNTSLLLTSLVLSSISRFLSAVQVCVFFGTFILLLAGAKKVWISRHQFHTHTRSQQQKKISFSIQFSDRCFFSSHLLFILGAEKPLHVFIYLLLSFGQSATLKKMGIVRTSYRLTLSIRQWTTFVPFPTHNQNNQLTNEHREYNRAHTYINRIRKKTSFKISFTRCLPHQSHFIKIN